AGLAGDAVDLAEAEARSLAGLLGGVERLDGSGEYVFGHAAPGIGHRQLDITPGGEVGRDGARHLGQVDGADRDGPALGHRVPRVEREIENGVLDLPGIDEYRPHF